MYYLKFLKISKTLRYNMQSCEHGIIQKYEIT